MHWTFNDGGRRSAHYRGDAEDCVVRAIAIAAELPYGQVYKDVAELIELWAHTRRDRTARSLRLEKAFKRNRTPRMGVPHKITDYYIDEVLGWRWTPTMKIGTGCTVHLRADELPSGRLIVNVSKHLVAVIDGVIHDTHDCSRGGTRCVYGYWTKP